MQFNGLVCFSVGLVAFLTCDWVVCDVQCPPGWFTSESACYLFGHYGMTYVEAQSFCTHHKGQLIEMESAHENAFIKDRLREMKENNWWLGMTDEYIDGEWVWFESNQKLNFSDWSPHEPQSLTTDEDCAVMHGGLDFQWADTRCSGSYYPLCKKKSVRCECCDVDPNNVLG